VSFSKTSNSTRPSDSCYFEVFEKLTRACYIQIGLQTMLLPIQNSKWWCPCLDNSNSISKWTENCRIFHFNARTVYKFEANLYRYKIISKAHTGRIRILIVLIELEFTFWGWFSSIKSLYTVCFTKSFTCFLFSLLRRPFWIRSS
jgi:hypothetical protein